MKQVDEWICMREFGWFVNPQGYSLVKIGEKRWGLMWTVAIYEFTAAPIASLSFVTPMGIRIQRARHGTTDLGSIPPCLQQFPSLSKDRFLLSYLYHDSACANGGLWMRHPGDETYSFHDMSRLECDQLLCRMVGAEGGNAAQRRAIYAGVRIGAKWQRHPLGEVVLPK